MFCTNCGSNLSVGAKFCGSCGFKVNAEPPQNQQKPGEQPELGNKMYEEVTSTIMDPESKEELMKRFIGKNWDFYLPQWNSGKALRGWNWAAMFLAPMWLAYRKMYVYTVIYLLIGLVMGAVLSILSFDNTITIFSIVLSILTGFFGNILYYRFTKKKIEKHKSNPPGIRPIEKLGGTSGIAASIVLGLIIIARIIAASGG